MIEDWMLSNPTPLMSRLMTQRPSALDKSWDLLCWDFRTQNKLFTAAGPESLLQSPPLQAFHHGQQECSDTSITGHPVLDKHPCTPTCKERELPATNYVLDSPNKLSSSVFLPPGQTWIQALQCWKLKRFNEYCPTSWCPQRACGATKPGRILRQNWERQRHGCWEHGELGPAAGPELRRGNSFKNK